MPPLLLFPLLRRSVAAEWELLLSSDNYSSLLATFRLPFAWMASRLFNDN